MYVDRNQSVDGSTLGVGYGDAIIFVRIVFILYLFVAFWLLSLLCCYFVFCCDAVTMLFPRISTFLQDDLKILKRFFWHVYPAFISSFHIKLNTICPQKETLGDEILQRVHIQGIRPGPRTFPLRFPIQRSVINLPPLWGMFFHPFEIISIFWRENFPPPYIDTPHKLLQVTGKYSFFIKCLVSPPFSLHSK